MNQGDSISPGFILMTLRLTPRLLWLLGAFVILLASVRAEENTGARMLFAAISSADSVELLRLDPTWGVGEGSKPNRNAPGTIDGWKIVVSKTIKDRGDITRLAEALRHSVEEADLVTALCFSPRHALRFRIGKIERVVVVCFECLHGYAKGIPGAESFHLERGGGAQADWEDVFAKYGIPRLEKR
jgi:hypothetical protein